MSTMEIIVLGALAILVLLWMQPGIKSAMARSRQAEADWKAVLLPLGLVVMFVIFLISMV